jgi:hypothetical protein
MTILLQRGINHDRLGKTFKAGLCWCREYSAMIMDQAPDRKYVMKRGNHDGA